ALKGPGAALLDLVGNTRQRDERPELARATGELERGDVVLDAVVVASEGRRAKQVDRAVRADEARAGRGRLRRCDERRGDRGKASEEPSHSSLLSGLGPGCPYDAGWLLAVPGVSSGECESAYGGRS